MTEVSVQPKDQTPLLPLSGTRKVVRTPTNPFETADTSEVFVPKEIIARRIQDIFAGPNKGRKADHYLVVWETVSNALLDPCVCGSCCNLVGSRGQVDAQHS